MKLLNERVREILAYPLGLDAKAIPAATPEEVSRLAQHVLDLRTANAMLEDTLAERGAGL
jgi:hypothetical protein